METQNRDNQKFQMARPKRQPGKAWGNESKPSMQFAQIKSWFSKSLTALQEQNRVAHRNWVRKIRRLQIYQFIRKWYLHVLEVYREQIRIQKATLILLIILTVLLTGIFSIMLVGCYHEVNPDIQPYEETLTPTLTNTSYPTSTATPTSTSTPEPLPEINKG
jgi:hypothetical protein